VSQGATPLDESTSPGPRPVAVILTGVLVLMLAVGIVSVSFALGGGDSSRGGTGGPPGAGASPGPEADGGRTACAELVAPGSPLAELGGGALTPLPDGWREEAYRLGNLAARSPAWPVRIAGRDLAGAIYLDGSIPPIDVHPRIVVLAAACTEAGYVTAADVRLAIRSAVG
jgi:hypothetical protein